MRIRYLLIPLTLVAVPVLGAPLIASADSIRTTEHIVAVQTSADGPTNILAAGPVTGTGVDNPANDNRDRLVFDDGALVIDHKAAKTDAHFDPATCVGHVVESGTYTVVGGTGAYRHARGNGTYKTNLVMQGCDQNKPPAIYLLTIQAEGPLSV